MTTSHEILSCVSTITDEDGATSEVLVIKVNPNQIDEIEFIREMNRAYSTHCRHERDCCGGVYFRADTTKISEEIYVINRNAYRNI